MSNKEKITEMYMSGIPTRDIAVLFNITPEAVYQKLRRLEGWKGIKRHHSNQRSLERLTGLRERSDDIVDGWLRGITMTDLAKEFSTSRTEISKIVKSVLGTTRRRHKRDEKIREEYKNGSTQVSLSKKYNISQPCISRIINSPLEG